MSSRIYTLSVPGEPVPKGRPRVYNGHGITPKRTMEAENNIRRRWISQYSNMQPLTGDIHISIDFYMPDRHVKDWDNLAKLVTDALNGIAYADDRQIVTAIVTKWLPSLFVPGRNNRPRRRKTGDPLTTCEGDPYDPHTLIRLYQIRDRDEEHPAF